VKGIKQLSGYDISPQAIALADQVQSENLKFFQEDIFQSKPEVSDLLLVIDVLEHIDDFYGFLRNIKTRGRNFVFHIPLDLSSRTIMKPHVLFQQRQSVGHIHYFSKEMILWALPDLR
jgi:2-polyprenyl-3-methyl-5-hydroxy-6-metoxy-1,4-benzoquinol methylase